jgi:hypothetical protein
MVRLDYRLDAGRETLVAQSANVMSWFVGADGSVAQRARLRRCSGHC